MVFPDHISYSLLLVFLLMLHSAQDEQPPFHTMRSLKCNHLEMTDDNQDNTFIQGKRVCCMCPKGHRYAGICNSTHPNTTQCIPCANGMYIHFEPHMERKCFFKKKLFCIPPKIYNPGTTSEEPSCQCPQGMVLQNSGRECIRSISSERTTAMAETSTYHTTPTRSFSTISTTRNSTTYMSKTEAHSHSQHQTIALHPTSSSVPDDSGGPNYYILVGGVLSCIAVALIIYFIRRWRKQRIRNRRDWACEPTELCLKAPSQIPLQRTDPQVQPLLPTSEPSEIPNSARPITLSPADDRAHYNPLGQEPSGNVPQQATSTEHQRRRPMPDAVSQIVQRNEKFLLSIGTEFGKVLPKKEAVRIFRFIMGDDHDEVGFQDILGMHENDVKELNYQLMRFAMLKKGHKLTPETLLKEVENADPRLQILVDTIKTEMEKPYMLVNQGTTI